MSSLRVTDALMFNRVQSQSGAQSSTLEDLTNQIADGNRITHPADDPSATALMIQHRNVMARLDTTSTAATRSNDELTAADGAFSSLTDVLARVRELTVQMSNGDLSATDRASAANEVAALQQQAVNAMNTDVGGRYIFGGTIDNARPFDSSGNYTGDTNVRQIEIAPGTLQNVSIRADQVVKGVGGGTDMFGVLASLHTALTTNDASGVQATLTGLDAVVNQLSTARGQVGVYQTSLDTVVSINASAKLNLTKQVSDLNDVDIAEASVKLSMAQRSLEATLTAAAKSFNISLTNLIPIK